MKHVSLLIVPATAVSLASAQPVCSTPNTPIPDDASPGVQIPIIVDLPAGSLVDSITVDLDIDHDWVGDLVVTLTGPGGASAVLLDRAGIPSTGFPGPFGCGGRNVMATFDDAGPIAAESVCSLTGDPVISGVVRPAGALASLIGADAPGVWTLTVADNSAFDTGIVRSVCLDLEASRPCVPDLAAPFGTLNFFDISAFIGLFNAGDPAADVAAPFGSLNFFDVAEYIARFNAGCP